MPERSVEPSNEKPFDVRYLVVLILCLFLLAFSMLMEDFPSARYWKSHLLLFLIAGLAALTLGSFLPQLFRWWEKRKSLEGVMFQREWQHRLHRAGFRTPEDFEKAMRAYQREARQAAKPVAVAEAPVTPPVSDESAGLRTENDALRRKITEMETAHRSALETREEEHRRKLREKTAQLKQVQEESMRELRRLVRSSLRRALELLVSEADPTPLPPGLDSGEIEPLLELLTKRIDAWLLAWKRRSEEQQQLEEERKQEILRLREELRQAAIRFSQQGLELVQEQASALRWENHHELVKEQLTQAELREQQLQAEAKQREAEHLLRVQKLQTELRDVRHWLAELATYVQLSMAGCLSLVRTGVDRKYFLQAGYGLQQELKFTIAGEPDSTLSTLVTRSYGAVREAMAPVFSFVLGVLEATTRGDSNGVWPAQEAAMQVLGSALLSLDLEKEINCLYPAEDGFRPLLQQYLRPEVERARLLKEAHDAPPRDSVPESVQNAQRGHSAAVAMRTRSRRR